MLAIVASALLLHAPAAHPPLRYLAPLDVAHGQPGGERALAHHLKLIVTADMDRCPRVAGWQVAVYRSASAQLVTGWSEAGHPASEQDVTAYQQAAHHILARIEALSRRFPQLAAIRSLARTSETAHPFWISYHYAHGVSAAPNPNYRPGKKVSPTIKIFSPKDGIDLNIYFYEGQWPGQAMVSPIAIGKMNVVVFIEARENASLESLREEVIRIIQDERAVFLLSSQNLVFHRNYSAAG